MEIGAQRVAVGVHVYTLTRTLDNEKAWL
jgi:hypothetical protein